MPVRTHKLTRCSNKLRLPPSPLPCIPVPAEILTPPPSPQRATSFDDAEAVSPKFPYWGYLKALNPYTPWKNWYFSREKNRYSIGTNPSMDHCMGSVIAVPDLQCIITWDGTDSPDSVQITDYAGAHNASYAAMGTYINGYRLPPHVPITLRHGDRVTLECTPVMDSEEDLRFVWLSCNSDGWLPLQYQQNARTTWDRDMSAAQDDNYNFPPWADVYSTPRNPPMYPVRTRGERTIGFSSRR